MDFHALKLMPNDNRVQTVLYSKRSMVSASDVLHLVAQVST